MEMDPENVKKLRESIIYIENKETLVVDNDPNVIIEKVSSMYSNTKVPIYKINYNNKVLSRNNPYRISYNCITCGKNSIINLSLFVRKLNRNHPGCSHCVNYNEDKRHKQSLCMKGCKYKGRGSNYVKPPPPPKCNVLEKIAKDEIRFNEEMDDDFVTDYFKRHLTIEEFDRIKSKILSFQNGKFSNIDNFVYKPIVGINNQTKFNPYFYDKTRDVLEKPNYVTFKCEICTTEFTSKDLYTQKNKLKLLCRDCSLTNRIFRIRNWKKIKNENITYQSKLELKFIKYCNKHDILITDGPKLSYEWNNKTRIYIVDFCIPDSGILIELKDTHHWYKNNLANGKIDAKNQSAKKAIEDGKYKHFFTIFSKSFHTDIKKVLDKI